MNGRKTGRGKYPRITGILIRGGEIVDISRMISDLRPEPEDYLDDDGLIVCGKCHTRKESIIWFPLGLGAQKVRCTCDCEAKARDEFYAKMKQEELKRRIDDLRRRGVTDLEYARYTFATDDGKYPAATLKCKEYVEHWAEMRKENIGLLLYGPVGTGKTYLGCAVANALIDRGIPALITNMPKILEALKTPWKEGGNLIDKIQSYELVMIDDLGAERDTSTAAEQVYNIIDTRYRSGKPVIITTNLTAAEMKSPPNMAYKRVYDRILQNCKPIKLDGPSRRAEIGKAKRAKFDEIIGEG